MLVDILDESLERSPGVPPALSPPVAPSPLTTPDARPLTPIADTHFKSSSVQMAQIMKGVGPDPGMRLRGRESEGCGWSTGKAVSGGCRSRSRAGAGGHETV